MTEALENLPSMTFAVLSAWRSAAEDDVPPIQQAQPCHLDAAIWTDLLHPGLLSAHLGREAKLPRLRLEPLTLSKSKVQDVPGFIGFFFFFFLQRIVVFIDKTGKLQ